MVAANASTRSDIKDRECKRAAITIWKRTAFALTILLWTTLRFMSTTLLVHHLMDFESSQHTIRFLLPNDDVWRCINQSPSNHRAPRLYPEFRTLQSILPYAGMEIDIAKKARSTRQVSGAIA